ncbi:hypothetical protein EDD37DRAFT_698642 [Exophiala viscosa]|uniref:JmjC domain-containing protein n=1 Tax=Exophiala viscosa TaxID=2486360 RepID=A0AAN6DXY2_9EURO|nr:hypothetical protein EDD36DRAFT_200349 [Exophiala viscosa]KAI1619353.1 hypothetical protein EDD37DRAFT_698642 [Exophiala viscosa]
MRSPWVEEGTQTSPPSARHGHAEVAFAHMRETAYEMQLVAELLPQWQDEARRLWPGSRANQYLDVIAHSVGRRAASPAISAIEYMELLEQPDVAQYLRTDQKCRNAYVIDTSEALRPCLQASPPLMPIVVRDYVVGVLEYRQFLLNKPKVEVHDLGLKVPANGPPRTTHIKPGKLFKRMDKAGNAPVNFLNLAGIAPNPVPRALDGLHDYDIPWNIREYDEAGKAAKERVRDLTNGTRFTLYSTNKLVHLAHRDKGGVITAVRVHHGKKLWILYPYLAPDDISEWQQSDEPTPKPNPIALVPKPGDTLIMPQGQFHEVMSLEESLLTGIKIWDSRTLVHVCKAILEEHTLPGITNKDLEYECLEKLRVCEGE